MHLGGYLTLREDIKVYCSMHIPENRINGVLWAIPTSQNNVVFVEALTETARKCWDENCPNDTHADPIETWGKKLTDE